jgi:hypothetical protein
LPAEGAGMLGLGAVLCRAHKKIALKNQRITMTKNNRVGVTDTLA